MDNGVDALPRLVVRRDHQGVVRVLHELLGDRFVSRGLVPDFPDTAELVEDLYAFVDAAFVEKLDDVFEVRRVLLADDFGEVGGGHAVFLELGESAARADGLVLTNVSDEDQAVFLGAGAE